MVDLQELFQAARVAADDQGQAVVQIPLKLWEDWSGIEYDRPPDEFRLVMSIDYGGSYVAVMHQNRVISVSTWWGPEGVDLVAALRDYLKTDRKLLVGNVTAAHTILEIGSALPLEIELTRRVRGRNLPDGLPGEIEVSSVELRQVIEKHAQDIVWRAGNHILNINPYEMRSKPLNRIVLTGTFGRLRGLDKMLQEATKVPVVVK